MTTQYVIRRRAFDQDIWCLAMGDGTTTVKSLAHDYKSLDVARAWAKQMNSGYANANPWKVYKRIKRQYVIRIPANAYASQGYNNPEGWMGTNMTQSYKSSPMVRMFSSKASARHHLDTAVSHTWKTCAVIEPA